MVDKQTPAHLLPRTRRLVDLSHELNEPAAQAVVDQLEVSRHRLHGRIICAFPLVGQHYVGQPVAQRGYTTVIRWALGPAGFVVNSLSVVPLHNLATASTLRCMAIDQGLVTEANRTVMEVIRTFMRVMQVSQEALGDALGLNQPQISRRLRVPGSLSVGELVAFARFFRVDPSTLYKPVPEALGDLARAMASRATVSGDTVGYLIGAGQAA